MQTCKHQGIGPTRLVRLDFMRRGSEAFRAATSQSVSQGSTTLIPHSSKSLTFLVANPIFRERAMAAIWQSN